MDRFEDVFEQYAQPVYRFLLKLTQDESEAANLYWVLYLFHMPLSLSYQEWGRKVAAPVSTRRRGIRLLGWPVCRESRSAWTQWGGNILIPYLLHLVFIGCLWFIPYAPRFAVPVSFALALIALFSIHLCFKWRGRLFLYTDRRSSPPHHNGGLNSKPQTIIMLKNFQKAIDSYVAS